MALLLEILTDPRSLLIFGFLGYCFAVILVITGIRAMAGLRRPPVVCASCGRKVRRRKGIFVGDPTGTGIWLHLSCHRDSFRDKLPPC